MTRELQLYIARKSAIDLNLDPLSLHHYTPNLQSGPFKNYNRSYLRSCGPQSHHALNPEPANCPGYMFIDARRDMHVDTLSPTRLSTALSSL